MFGLSLFGLGVMGNFWLSKLFQLNLVDNTWFSCYNIYSLHCKFWLGWASFDKPRLAKPMPSIVIFKVKLELSKFEESKMDNDSLNCEFCDSEVLYLEVRDDCFLCHFCAVGLDLHELDDGSIAYLKRHWTKLTQQTKEACIAKFPNVSWEVQNA